MADLEPDLLVTEAEAVLLWREDVLIRAGFSSVLAAELAAKTEIDLHRLVDLVEQGCAPETAARILT